MRHDDTRVYGTGASVTLLTRAEIADALGIALSGLTSARLSAEGAQRHVIPSMSKVTLTHLTL